MRQTFTDVYLTSTYNLDLCHIGGKQNELVADNLTVPLHDHVILKTLNARFICRDVPKTPKQNSFKWQREAVTMP